jgi:hypothetical protein
MGWAESISNDGMRTRLMQRVAATWKNSDIESFTTYLEQCDLSAEQKVVLENARRLRPARQATA